jgi:hypothetical protein
MSPKQRPKSNCGRREGVEVGIGIVERMVRCEVDGSLVDSGSCPSFQFFDRRATNEARVPYFPRSHHRAVANPSVDGRQRFFLGLHWVRMCTGNWEVNERMKFQQ